MIGKPLTSAASIRIGTSSATAAISLPGDDRGDAENGARLRANIQPRLTTTDSLMS